MPESPDQEVQARLLREVCELAARRQKLEDDLKNLEAVNKALQESAALREIEAYKRQRSQPTKSSSH